MEPKPVYAVRVEKDGKSLILPTYDQTIYDLARSIQAQTADLEARLVNLDGDYAILEVRLADSLRKLETIKRMIEGRNILPVDDTYHGEIDAQQRAIDDALFSLILDEIGGNDDHNSGDVPAS